MAKAEPKPSMMAVIKELLWKVHYPKKRSAKQTEPKAVAMAVQNEWKEVAHKELTEQTYLSQIHPANLEGPMGSPSIISEKQIKDQSSSAGILGMIKYSREHRGMRKKFVPELPAIHDYLEPPTLASSQETRKLSSTRARTRTRTKPQITLDTRSNPPSTPRPEDIKKTRGLGPRYAS